MPVDIHHGVTHHQLCIIGTSSGGSGGLEESKSWDEVIAVVLEKDGSEALLPVPAVAKLYIEG